MVKLWIHEMMKIYYDRLIDRNDRDYFLNKIIENCKKYMKFEFTAEDILNIRFGDFLNK